MTGVSNVNPTRRAFTTVDPARTGPDLDATSGGATDVPTYAPGETTRATGYSANRAAPTDADLRSAPAGTVRAGELARQAEERRRFDPSPAATELYEAMHGGVFGLGTDEGRVMEALDGRTPAEIDQIREAYRDHYDRDLDADLASELGGEELDRAQNLMRGDASAADAARLREAMAGMGTDEAAIHATLDGRSEAEIDGIRDSYQQQYGRDLDADLDRELGGEELDRAQAGLRGDQAGADAARLRDAMAGLGTDEAAIFDTLDGQTAEGRAALEDSYREQYGRDLLADLGGELGGPALDRANALLDGRPADAAAAELEGHMRGLGTDEAGIESVLEGRSEAERAEIAAAYERTYGRSLDAALSSEMGGDDLARARSLAEDGGLSEAERLNTAMRGLGTDEAEVLASLEGRSAEEIDEIRADYRARFDRDLDADLERELGGTDRFDAQMAMRGRAETEEEALARLNERYAFERGDGNGIANAVMDVFSDQGELLDRNHARANAQHAAATADGSISDEERARLGTLTGYADADVGTYRDAQDSLADGAGTVAATAAGVAVVIGTAGTATPLVVAAGAAGAGAGARTLTTGMVSGRGYSLGDAASDGALGAVDGLATATGMRAGQAVAQGALRSTATGQLRRAGLEVSERSVAHMSRQVLANSRQARLGFGALEGTVDGAVGGALAAGGTTALRGETWESGVTDGLFRIGQQTALGGGLGAVGGGLGGALAGRNSTRIADDLIDRLPAANAGGRAGVNEWDFVSNGYRLEELEGIRQGLLRRNDVGRVQRNLQQLGVGADREMLDTAKRYLFDSQGIAFDQRNLAAWNRLSSGNGTVADAQFLVHEMAEIRTLQRVQQETGFDFMGRGFGDMTDRQARQWQSTFDREYLSAHRGALEAEYDYVARAVNDATNGRTNISRAQAAAADPRRAEARDWMLVDGRPMAQHRDWGRWQARANEAVDLGSRQRQRLGFGRNQPVTLAELIDRVRHLQID